MGTILVPPFAHYRPTAPLVQAAYAEGLRILEVEQKSKKKSERNDRLFAVPVRSHSENALRDVRDLTKPVQEELEKFFIATEELEDKKLKILGWEGPKQALMAIRQAAKSFAKPQE